MLSQCVTAAHPLIAQPFFFPLRRQVLLVNTIPNGQLFKSSQQFPSVTMHARAESWLGQRAALAGHGAVAGPWQVRSCIACLRAQPRAPRCCD